AQLVPHAVHLLGHLGFGGVRLLHERERTVGELGRDGSEVRRRLEVAEGLQLGVAFGADRAVEPRVEAGLGDRTTARDAQLELVEELLPGHHAGLAVASPARKRTSASRHASRSGSTTARHVSTRSRSLSTFALISSLTIHTYRPLSEFAWSQRSVSSALRSA